MITKTTNRILMILIELLMLTKSQKGLPIPSPWTLALMFIITDEFWFWADYYEIITGAQVSRLIFKKVIIYLNSELKKL